ncbi:NIC-domain-containing protein [Pseudovirgaria hyperparasitica]|uniref:NIC-domain-containing protein n=1 Tax=Pseudovirgaria hyperparasitica TaxID=470096 RepID=A0A6A6WF99_9PEZI|nr:NIC-domain-containing protein [Pseudovirgaria hyperparasitica]KAF2761403.1 NIC-domain-containing protein [Pseudovirgaria hyperparasitica]
MSGLFGNLGGQNKPAVSGLFGNSATTAPASTTKPAPVFGSVTPSVPQNQNSSLFGSTAAQPQQAGIGFGNPPATTTSQSTAIFGGSLGATPAFGNTGQSKPNLFGGAQTNTTSQSTGLFGGGAGATPAFGNVGTANAASNPPAGNSLFGGLGSNTSQSQPGQQSIGGSLFSSTFGAPPQGQTQQQQSQPQSSGSLSQSTTAPSQSAYFDHLLERGKKRNRQQNDAGQFNELPSLQLGLGDIARKVRNLGASGAPIAQARDSKAHYLLAASGVSTGAALKDLNSFKAQAGIGAAVSSQAADTDVDTYIANLQSQSTLAMIAEGLEQSKRDFDTFLEDNVQMEWDAQRKRIYEHLGLSKPHEDIDGEHNSPNPAVRGAFGKSSRRNRLGGTTNGAGMSLRGANMGRSVIGTPSNSRFGRSHAGADTGDKSGPGAQPENPLTRGKQEKFAEKVRGLNTARDRDWTYAILAQFSEVESQSGTDTSQQYVDAYKALMNITGEVATERPTDPGSIRERQYAKAYLDDSTNTADSIHIRKRILSGSLKFLENKFLLDVQNAVDKNRQEAAPGGVPSIISTVRAYITLRANRKELCKNPDLLQIVGDDYCWVVVFYLLRAGLNSEAVNYVKERERAFRAFDRRFLEYITAYAKDPERRLPREKQQSCSNEFKNRMQNPDLDPYRQACNKIVGRCDLGRRTLGELTQGMDDWVWLQFNLARETNRVEDSAGEAFGLDELRSTMAEIGKKHFPLGTEGTNGFTVFFFLQILAGMFEEAVSYLYQHNYVSAVHFAIALSYYGLLRASDFATSGSEILTFTTRNKPQLNFARMIGLYTMDFRAAKSDVAVEYLILIALNADLPGQLGQTHTDVCQEALRELVLETREFASLIGDIRNDGQRIKGAIERRLRLVKLQSDNDFLRKVTINAAHVADSNGRMTDAVLLYYLSNEMSKAFDAVLRVVFEYLATDLGTSATIEPLKPRATDTQANAPTNSSLSLLATEDPLQLGEAFKQLRERWGDVNNYTTQTMEQDALLNVQLLMVKAKRLVEAGNWGAALDCMTQSNILPLSAKGNTAAIRQSVTNMNQWDYIMRNAGNFILWAILCCGKQREVIMQRQYENAQSKNVADDLLQKARDLMVFAGLVRYKLSPRVYEALAEVGQDVGV